MNRKIKDHILGAGNVNKVAEHLYVCGFKLYTSTAGSLPVSQDGVPQLTATTEDNFVKFHPLQDNCENNEITQITATWIELEHFISESERYISDDHTYILYIE